MTREDFGQKIKLKYPQYSNINNDELADRIIEKYPVYKSQVTEGFEKGFFGRVENKLGKRREDIGEAFRRTGSQIVGGEEKPLAPTAFGAGARLGLRTGGAVAGGAFDILIEGVKSALGKKGTESIKETVGGVVGKALEIDPIEKVVTNLTAWAKANPEAAKDLENIVDLTAIAPTLKGAKVGVETGLRGLKTVTGAARGRVREVGEIVALGGAATEKTGKKMVSMLYSPTVGQAKQVLDYQAKSTMLQRLGWAAKDIEKAPITIADVVLKYNLSGFARGNIGSRARKIANDLWQNQVNLALNGIKEKVSKKVIFDGVRRDINKIKDLSTRKAWLNAFESLEKDFKHVSQWSYKTLDEIKSGMYKQLPEKIFRGENIAGNLNNVRAMFAANARQTIMKKLPEAIKTIYSEYGSLKEIATRGAKALTRGFDAGILGVTSEAIRIAVTPIATIGGKAIHTLGTGIKRIGQRLQK